MSSKTYNEDSIYVFEGLEGVRKRPEMYIGTTSNPTPIIREVVDNSIDEYLSGNNKKIYIDINKDYILVADKGRGIPVKKHKVTGKSTLETIMTKLHAGGKFDKDAYNGFKRGLHGVGVSVTNALSLTFEVWTYRNKKWYYQKYEKGIPKSKVKIVKKIPLKRWNKGTIIKFKPDNTIFKSIVINKNYIEKELKDISVLLPKLKIDINFYSEKYTFFSTSYKDYIEQILKDKEKIGKPLIHQSNKVDLALVWLEDDKENMSYYVNTIEATGTHQDTFRRALAYSLNRIKDRKLRCDSNDYRSGLYGLLHYKCEEPTYSSQTKSELTSNTSELEKYLKNLLYNFFTSNKSLANKIINKAVAIKEVKTRYKETLKAISSTRITRKNALPFKLSKSNAPAYKREIYLVEGDSAAGTARKAKLPFQEILPLRGKPVNAYKNSLEKTLSNSIVSDILKSVGIDLTKNNPLSSMRVSKVILLSDADVDGYHINLLLIALFNKIVPDLIKKGYLYIVETPLYHAKVVKGKNVSLVTGNTYKEVERKLNGKKAIIIRSKGWGEIDVPALNQIAFNPETRQLIKVKSVDKENENYVVKLLSDDTKERKKLLGLV